MFHRMRKDLAHAPPEPAWPGGLRLAGFDPGRAAGVHALLRDAYAHGGGSVGPFASWWPSLRDDPEYDPSLVFVAVDPADRVAGVAQCWTSAFVKDLAVASEWRRRGLGEALLMQVFACFWRRGARQVELKVLTDNPFGAERLYRRVGMHVVPP